MAQYRFVRKYVGPLKAAILDFSGTTADKYVIAPAVVFVEVFKTQNVPISMQEARGPMGLRKDLHIKALTEVPEIRERWKSVHGAYPNDDSVAAMFKDFVPAQLACLRQYTTLLPGVAETVNTLRKDYNMKIGATTGFLRSMVDVLLDDAAKQGFVPDSTVAGDEVINGARPKPHMVYKNMDLLDISPVQSVVKVDDTTSGVGEALEAGCWGVGIARYSNYMDINTLDEEKELSEQQIAVRLRHSRDFLTKYGAHYVIDEPKDLVGVVKHINKRLRRGERP